jgi:hypothetical protein
MPINSGQLIDPEGATSITNLSSRNGVADRVEFKKKLSVIKLTFCINVGKH